MTGLSDGNRTAQHVCRAELNRSRAVACMGTKSRLVAYTRTKLSGYCRQMSKEKFMRYTWSRRQD